MSQNIKNLGTFVLKSGNMRVSDPGYGKSTWCAGVIPDCRTGRWEALAFFCNDELFFRRVSLLAARAVDGNAGFDLLDSLDKLERANFEVGVDSGQAGMYDDETYGLDSTVTGIPNPSGKDCEEPGERWYKYCCDITLSSERAGVIPTGAVSRSGYGDGGYPVFFQRGEDGKVDLIAIRYILEDAKDDNEDYNNEDFSTDDLVRLIAITSDKGEVKNG